MSEYNTRIIDEFRANAGEVPSHVSGTMPLLLLHTRGAKSGEDHVSPVARFTDGNGWLIVGSKGGAPTNPGWVHNLRANADVVVEVGSERHFVRAIELWGEPYDRAWRQVVAEQPTFATYLEKTDRHLPVFRLSPR